MRRKVIVQQAPIHNASTIGASVYSHSGEFAIVHRDLQLPGRGLNFAFIRAYRSSLADQAGEFGRGWSSSIIKRIEHYDKHMIFHDGKGNVYKFVRDKEGNYKSRGFYGIILRKENNIILLLRHGIKYLFDLPEQGGRLLSIEDRNQNTIQISYSINRINILDTLKRNINILLSKRLISELKDHTGRTWKYKYDEYNRLITVLQPATEDHPYGTSIQYSYDGNHRLISITDAKGQTYLVNQYDRSGKVISQEHGNGVFSIEYQEIGKVENGNGLSVFKTTCIEKSGAKQVLKHDWNGNVIVSTLFVLERHSWPRR